MHLDAEQAEKNRLCYNCHDEDNSRDFEFSKFYGEIVHKGLGRLQRPEGAPRDHAETGQAGAARRREVRGTRSICEDRSPRVVRAR